MNSSDSNPHTAVMSYEWTSHLVPLENLTEDGGVEDRNQKNWHIEIVFVKYREWKCSCACFQNKSYQ